MKTAPAEPKDDLERLIRRHPHRWTTEAVELGLVLDAVEDMASEDWLRWLDELSFCLSSRSASAAPTAHASP